MYVQLPLSICGIVTQHKSGGKNRSTLIEFLLNYMSLIFHSIIISFLSEEMIEKYKMKEKLQRAEFYMLATSKRQLPRNPQIH